MKKYNLDGFLANLCGWVDSFKVGTKSGVYTVVRGKTDNRYMGAPIWYSF